MQILTVVGARPQFIKAAVVSRALKAKGIQEVLVHTGQHYDAAMSEVFFQELDLPTPGHHLGIGGLQHGAMTGRMLEALEDLMLKQRPDWILVYGDTNSTLAGALAGAKLQIPIAHVEAGMRSFNRAMPEELNRVLTDHLSQLLFVTSAEPKSLLAQEGIQNGVHLVGDVMYDAQRVFLPAAQRLSLPQKLKLNKPYALVTLHRAENTDNPTLLKSWLEQLSLLSQELELVFPVHPRTRQAISDCCPGWNPPRVRLLEPLGYFEMLALEQDAALILTDSGGVQKEAFYLNIPCLTLRRETEWTETVTLGRNQLIGDKPEQLVEIAHHFLTAPFSGPPPEIYGDGYAADKIAAVLAA